MRLGPSSRSLLVAVVLAGCATTRVVPVPAVGVAVDAHGAATAGGEGVEVVVWPSAWQGRPAYLPSYVTSFHLLIVNRLGDAPRVLTLPFAVERAAGAGMPAARA